MKTLALPLFLLGVCLLAAPAAAQIDSSGELGVEGRLFTDDDNPLTQDDGLGMFGRLEWSHRQGVVSEKIRVFGRLDSRDDGRTVLLVEEGYVQFRSGRFRLRAGWDIVNWTATEAFHPADVINARNFDSDLENLEKLGEPMLTAQVGLLEGMTASVLLMPVYTKSLFPSARSRLNFVPGLDLGANRVLLDRDGDVTDNDFGPQAAFRLQQVLGSADVSVHALEQMDRLQPLAAFNVLTGAPATLFQTVRQVGGTYQQVMGSLIAKLETAYRWFVPARRDWPYAPLGELAPVLTSAPYPDRNHGTVAIGFEYGIVHENSSESTLLLEGQFVYGAGSDRIRKSLSPFQRDILVGYRFALGDVDGKELLLGAIVDLQDAEEFLVNASYQQRLGDTWRVKLGLRLFQAPARPFGSGGLATFREADHVRLSLTRHF